MSGLGGFQAGAISEWVLYTPHCVIMRTLLLTQSVLVFCHHGICNEGHVFVLPRCVKDTTNVYESIRCPEYIEEWSVASDLSSVSHEASPYFFVKWGQDPHVLLLQTIIGRRQIFGGPSVPSGQNCIFPMHVGAEKIKRQTFSKHCFTPRRNKVLMRGLLDQ